MGRYLPKNVWLFVYGMTITGSPIPRYKNYVKTSGDIFSQYSPVFDERNMSKGLGSGHGAMIPPMKLNHPY
jgi:hypothetical protein